jgi:hypothetical protein
VIRLPAATIEAARLVAEEAIKIAEAGWCKGAYARTAKGAPTIVSDENAACFCAHGSIMRAKVNLGRKNVAGYRTVVTDLNSSIKLESVVTDMLLNVLDLGDRSIAQWNDSPARVQSDVVNAFKSVKRRFDEAIATDQ